MIVPTGNIRTAHDGTTRIAPDALLGDSLDGDDLVVAFTLPTWNNTSA